MAQIFYYGELRDLVQKSDESIDVKTIQDVLKHIEKAYGKLAKKQAKSSLITINTFNILKMKGYQTAVSPDDKVCFFPVCGGG